MGDSGEKVRTVRFPLTTNRARLCVSILFSVILRPARAVESVLTRMGVEFRPHRHARPSVCRLGNRRERKKRTDDACGLFSFLAVVVRREVQICD